MSCSCGYVFPKQNILGNSFPMGALSWDGNSRRKTFRNVSKLVTIIRFDYKYQGLSCGLGRTENVDGVRKTDHCPSLRKSKRKKSTHYQKQKSCCSVKSWDRNYIVLISLRRNCIIKVYGKTMNQKSMDDQWSGIILNQIRVEVIASEDLIWKSTRSPGRMVCDKFIWNLLIDVFCFLSGFGWG